MSVRVNHGGKLCQVELIEIIFGGDAECALFAQALEFALTTLHKVAAHLETTEEEEFE